MTGDDKGELRLTGKKGKERRRPGAVRPEAAGQREGFQDMGRFWREAGRIVPDRGKREAAMEEIASAIREKDMGYKPPLWELLWTELRYISLYFWIAQGVIAAAVYALIRITAAGSGGLPECLRWGSVAAALMGMLICGGLGKHFSSGMAELEQSCYLNLPQMWTMRMALTGSVDILLILLFSGEIARSTQAVYGQICVYLLVPFVLSNICCMLLVLYVRGCRGRYGQLVTALLSGSVAALPPTVPCAYELQYLWIWGLAMVSGIGILVWQMRLTYRKFARGEVLCWN